MKAILLLETLAVCTIASPAPKVTSRPSRSTSNEHLNDYLTLGGDLSGKSSEDLKRPIRPVGNPYRNFVDDADAHAVMGE